MKAVGVENWGAFKSILGGINFDLIFICFVLNPPTALLADTRQQFAINMCQLNLHFNAKSYTVTSVMSPENCKQHICHPRQEKKYREKPASPGAF